jgi:hypothetical protein
LHRSSLKAIKNMGTTVNSSQNYFSTQASKRERHTETEREREKNLKNKFKSISTFA